MTYLWQWLGSGPTHDEVDDDLMRLDAKLQARDQTAQQCLCTLGSMDSICHEFDSLEGVDDHGKCAVCGHAAQCHYIPT